MTLNSNRPTVSLDSIAVGSTATLVALQGARSFRRRLMELGLLPGTPITLVRRNDVGGFVELEVRRARVSVRIAEARDLHVASRSA